jgi:Fic family protein
LFKNKEHYKYFNISRQSASRELNELAKQNILIKEKDKKQTFLQLIQKIGVKNI